MLRRRGRGREEERRDREKKWKDEKSGLRHEGTVGGDRRFLLRSDDITEQEAAGLRTGDDTGSSRDRSSRRVTVPFLQMRSAPSDSGPGVGSVPPALGPGWAMAADDEGGGVFCVWVFWEEGGTSSDTQRGREEGRAKTKTSNSIHA